MTPRLPPHRPAQETLHDALHKLHIYHSDSPFGPWTPHASNPVVDNVRGARPAGRMLKLDGGLLRFAQDGTGAYGKAVVAYRVEQLNATVFKQTEIRFAVAASQPGTAAWDWRRRHHVDAHLLEDGSWVAALDGDSR